MDARPESTFIEFILYNNWANQQVLQACQNLSEEQLAATTPGAYGTIHRTLGHIIAAEADYVGRLTGAGPQPPFQWEDGPALADISAFAEQVAGALLDVVQRIPPTHMVHEEEDGNTIDYQARPSSSRSSTTASSTAPTSPPSSAASVSPRPKWMAGATSGRTRTGLS